MYKRQGKGSIVEMPARSLRGQIAVMEMSHYENWKQPFSAGATAVLLLGGKDDRAKPPAQQALYMPRYYVPEGPLAKALREGKAERATVHCDASWRTVTAKNVCALVPAAAGAEALPPVAVAVPYDSMSVIMGLAPGADAAVDAAFALNLLRRTAAAPPPRAVLFCFVDAYAFNQLGMRHLLGLLTVTPQDRARRDYVKMDGEQLEEYQEILGKVQKLGDGREALNQLSAPIRAVVVLKDIYDWSHAEIAEHLDISVTAAKVRLHRGRKELRQRLRPWKDGGS